jgi:hypothetical protein
LIYFYCAGDTLWHLQKYLHYFKCIVLKFTPSIKVDIIVLHKNIIKTFEYSTHNKNLRKEMRMNKTANNYSDPMTLENMTYKKKENCNSNEQMLEEPSLQGYHLV